jgi:predicted AAA+ superfamily ATPase
MYINRSIDKYLEDWKKESNRKPLMIRGARQIGKSTLITAGNMVLSILYNFFWKGIFFIQKKNKRA